MEALAQLFPLAMFFAGLALAVLVIRLDRRLSRGARSAGPRQAVRAAPVGQQQTPWELAAIHDQIRWGQSSRARTDLVKTINRLTVAAGVTDPAFVLPPDAADGHIAAIIGHLEQTLELPPLGVGPPGAGGPGPPGHYPADSPVAHQ